MLFFDRAIAQDSDKVLSIYDGSAEIIGFNSVTLKPGFHIPAGKTVRIYTNSSLVNFPSLQTQLSTGQNYILTRTFREPVTVAQLGQQRTVGQENQTVQYIDGLGRLLQTVSIQASPRYKDIVQHVEYDGFGREAVKYLPYAEQSSANGSFKGSAKTNQENFYKVGGGWDATVSKTPNPYAVTIFEESPLNRIREQGASGTPWQPLAVVGTGHTVKTTYGSNSASGLDVVRLWTLTANGASGAANYPGGKLHRTTVRDENTVNTTARSGAVDEYKDLKGQVVLRRLWESETRALNTYYVYDDFGNLRYVIPPGVTATSFIDQATDPVFDSFVYSYRYDENSRMVERKIPGKDWEYMVYNENDQIVLTQDAVQRGRKEWTYTRYDAFGNVTSTGLYTNTVKLTLADMQALVNAGTGPLWETRTGVDYPAPATTFPLAGTGITIMPHIINYYDDYSFAGATALPVAAITRSTMTRSLQTGTKVYKTDGTLPLLTVLYYDDYGRVIQTASQNHLEGKDYITNTYSFMGELLTSTRVHTPKTGAATSIVTTSTYDHVGRLTATKEKIGTQAEVILAANSYNEVGQLKSKAFGKAGTETAYVDTINYTYNERGWTKRIASANFTQSLMYEDGGTVRQWNGNIAQQSWRFGAPPAVTSTFEYSYDKLNRLLSGASTPTGTVSMTEAITYDDIGNIKTLKRDAGTVTTYAYTGNKLSSLTGGISGNYTYDVNGNAKTDRTGMAFTYNYLNLPQTATKSGTSVSYLYDATGTKLRKSATVGTTTAPVRDYVGGIEYNGSNIDIIHNDVGYALRSGASYVYHYNLTDNLGNVRATLKRGSTATAVDVVQRDNYYPFGMRKVVAGGNNKYLYNGKEIQGELGDQYDYGARYYDPVIGRWNVPDPLADTYYSHSPYNYALNDPIRKLDPNGMWVEIPGGWSTSDLDDITAFMQQMQGNKEEDPPEKWQKGFDWSYFTQGLNYDGTTFGKANTASGLVFTGLENSRGSFRVSTTTKGFSPKYYGNSWGGNQYAKTFNIGKVGRGLGNLGAGIGTLADAYGVHEYLEDPNSSNAVHPGKAALNLGMTVYGMFVNPPAGIAYGLIDNFYPGGWGNGYKSGFFYDQKMNQFQLDRISRSGPNYIRLVPLGNK